MFICLTFNRLDSVYCAVPPVVLCNLLSPVPPPTHQTRRPGAHGAPAVPRHWCPTRSPASMSADLQGKVVAVVGAGLVGSLEAVYLAQRGAEVHVYEYREDIRTMEHVAGRSINLAMSVRGLAALHKAGLDEHVKEEYGIPMNARWTLAPLVPGGLELV